MRTEIIRKKIAEIQESLEILRDNLPESLEEFESLGLVKDGMYKRIEFCIEDVFDICAIINADLKLGIPRSDDDILEILVRKGIFDEEMKKKLKGMKGFRNIIVHRYAIECGGKDTPLSMISTLNTQLCTGVINHDK